MPAALHTALTAMPCFSRPKVPRSSSHVPAASTSVDTAVRKEALLWVYEHTSTPATPSSSPRHNSTLSGMAKRPLHDVPDGAPACPSRRARTQEAARIRPRELRQKERASNRSPRP